MWTDLARVKRFLGIAVADESDDDVLTDAIASASYQAFTARARSGYTDESETVPNAAVADGTTRLAALLYQSRGTGDGFVLIDTQPAGTPGYEQRRTISGLLGIPRPTIDGPPAPEVA